MEEKSYIQQWGSPKAFLERFDLGYVSAKATVYAAALVAYEHTSVHGRPFRV